MSALAAHVGQANAMNAMSPPVGRAGATSATTINVAQNNTNTAHSVNGHASYAQASPSPITITSSSPATPALPTRGPTTAAATNNPTTAPNANANTNRRKSRSQSSSQPQSRPQPQPQAQQPQHQSHASQAIYSHTEAFMQLIREQCVLASQASLAEIAALRIELEERSREVLGLRQEVESLRRQSSSATGTSVYGTAATASTPTTPQQSPQLSFLAQTQDPRLLQYELENRRREVEALRAMAEEGRAANGELAVLKCTVDALKGEYRKARAEVRRLRKQNPNTSVTETRVKEEPQEKDLSDLVSNTTAEMQAEMEGLRRRCEDLERENERLRKSEALLRQRADILESLNASTSTSLQPIDSLPDLGALGSYLSRQPNPYSASLTEAHAKKRRLDGRHGALS